MPVVEDRDQALMRRYGLVFKEDCELLVCSRCNIALGKTLDHHMKLVHHQTMSAGSKRYLIPYIRPSLYLQEQQHFLPAVDFRPVLAGLKCSDCSYFCIDTTGMYKHVKTHNPVATSVSCVVQRVNDSTRTPYVGVIPRNQVGVGAPVAAVPGLIDRRVHMRMLAQERALPMEEGRRLGIFYSSSGFVTKPGAVDPFDGVNYASYVASLSPDDPSHAPFIALRETLILAIEAVNASDFQLRFAVSYGRRPFKALETANSLRDNSLLMARFARFLVELLARPIPGVVFSVELVGKIESFRDDHSLISLHAVVAHILEEDPRLSVPSEPLALFVRFCCFQVPGDTMSVASVERLIAKVYLFYL